MFEIKENNLKTYENEGKFNFLLFYPQKCLKNQNVSKLGIKKFSQLM